MIKRLVTSILLLSLGLYSLLAQVTSPSLFPEDDAGTPEDQQVAWETIPGVRYEVQSNTNLSEVEGWTTELGYPSVASDIVDTLPFDTSAVDAKFFRVVQYDEQAPVITERFPNDGDFAIKRFETITLSLEDFTGVDPATISLDIDSLGTFTVANSELSYTDGALTFDNGGDSALGFFGDSISATLTVADTLGNSNSYSWTFDLEVEPVYEANSFIFGSPDAQRAGQFVKQTPTRVLAQRWADGPVRMTGSSPDWTLESVLPGEIAITYTSASAPTVFLVEQYLANLAPVTVGDIFYRQITAITDDAASKTLTLSTIDVSPAKIVTEGSLRLSDEDLAFVVDQFGTIIRMVPVRALSATGQVEIDPFGVSFDDMRVFGSYTDGGGLQQDLFGLPIPVNPPLVAASWDSELTLEEASISVTPSLSAAIEITELNGLREFYSKIDLSVNASLISEYSFLASAASGETEFSLFDSQVVVPLGATPLWVEISPYVKLKADYTVVDAGTIRTGIQGEVSASLMVDYQKERAQELYFTPELGKPVFDSIAPELSVSGESNANTSLVAGMDIRFANLASVDVYADPGVHLTGSASSAVGDTPFSGSLSLVADAHLNAVVGIAESDNLSWVQLPAMIPVELLRFPTQWQFPESAAFAIIQQPSDGSFAVGDEVTLQVATNAQSAVSYQWYKDGEPLPGRNRSSLSLFELSASHAGDYTVAVRSEGELIVSASAFVSIASNASVRSVGFSYIPGGDFQMGDALDGLHSVETVNVPPFYIGRTEVTYEQWHEVFSWAIVNGYSFDHAGSGKGSSHPVHSVSWYDVVKWCNAASELEGRSPVYLTSNGSVYRTGQVAVTINTLNSGYRLPSSAEWEKAARGGLTGRRFPMGDTISHSLANYKAGVAGSVDYDTTAYAQLTFHPDYNDTSMPFTSPVGSFPANGYGLYDVAGNLWEWCNDSSGSGRVFRGGNWLYGPSICRVALRESLSPSNAYNYFGFRLARSQ